MADRHLHDWLEGYLAYTENQESPEKLHLWTGFALISAALKRQVWMDRGYYKLYPNIFVLIVAESARVRKSSALDIGINLIRKAVPDLFYMGGSMTPEGLLKHMNRVKAIVKEGKNEVKYDSHVLIHADELATLFGYDRTRASRLTILLTEIYSSKDEHLHTLAGEGQILLRNLYPTLLAATDPRNLKVLPEDAIGGLIGRLIFVGASEKRKLIAWPNPNDQDRILWNNLKEDLHTMSLLQGEMVVTDRARNLFTEWYEARGSIQTDDPRLEAFNERCHDTALKLAMLISVSKSNDLILDEAHLAGGITFIEKQLPEFARVATWASTNVFAQNKMKLIDMMQKAGGVGTRRAALKLLQVPLDDMVMLEETLSQQGVMTVVITGRNVLYKLSKDYII